MNVLHIIPHKDFFPPNNGGALRCYHISQELAKHFNLTILSRQNKNDFRSTPIFSWNNSINAITPNKKETKTLFSKIGSAIIYRWHQRNILKPANIVFLELYPTLKKLLKENSFDVIIFEHLSAEELSVVVRKKAPKTKLIIDEHNVDYLLYQQENAENTKLISDTFKREKSLYKRIDQIWTCSEEDQRVLYKLNKGKVYVYVVPNGVDSTTKKFSTDTTNNKKSIMFCGALTTQANKDGLLWFYNTIWPLLNNKDISFNIIGKGGDLSDFSIIKNDPTVNFLGEVESLEPYYRNNHIAIVPLRIGSGTRLKILEAMSFGNPVISTSKGAEGINYKDKENILIADTPEEFANAIMTLIDDKSLSDKIKINARHLIEDNYSWEIIGNTIKNILT